MLGQKRRVRDSPDASCTVHGVKEALSSPIGRAFASMGLFHLLYKPERPSPVGLPAAAGFCPLLPNTHPTPRPLSLLPSPNPEV